MLMWVKSILPCVEYYQVVNKDSDYHMTTRASVSFTCFEVPSGEGVRLLERDRFGSILLLGS